MWRDGKLLVIGTAEPFPDWCIHTNQPADGQWFRQELRWLPIWSRLIGLLLLPFGWLTPFGWIAAGATVKRATVHVGVSRRFLRRRRRTVAVAVLILAAGYGFIAWAILWVPWGIGNTRLVMCGALVLGWGLFRLLKARQIVAAKRITDEFIWLKGVHPQFLAELPEWPADGKTAP